MARHSVDSALSWLFSRALLLACGMLALSFSPAARKALPQLGALHEATLQGWVLVAPGGTWHPAAFIEHKGHLLVEGLLLAVITALLLQGSTKPRHGEEEPLTEKASGGLPRPGLDLGVVRCACAVLWSRTSGGQPWLAVVPPQLRLRMHCSHACTGR